MKGVVIRDRVYIGFEKVLRESEGGEVEVGIEAGLSCERRGCHWG